MTKRQLIDRIVSINHSAAPSFLARFDEGDLDAYLRHLQEPQTPRLAGDGHRHDRYFENLPTVTIGETPVPAEPEQEPDLDGMTHQLDLNLSDSALFSQSYEELEEEEAPAVEVFVEHQQEPLARRAV